MRAHALALQITRQTSWANGNALLERAGVTARIAPGE